MGAVSSTPSSSPGRVRIAAAIWFAIVADGRKTAASWPSSAAARRSSSVVVGSSPHCSSPTSAVAIAARIAGDGRVIVSVRRSITPTEATSAEVVREPRLLALDGGAEARDLLDATVVRDDGGAGGRGARRVRLAEVAHGLVHGNRILRLERR